MTDLTSYAPVRVFLAGLWRLLFSVPLFLVAYVVFRATILNPPKAAPAAGDPPLWAIALIGVVFALFGLAVLLSGIGRIISAFARDCYFRAGPGGIAVRCPVRHWFGRYSLPAQKWGWADIDRIVHHSYRISGIPAGTELHLYFKSGKRMKIERSCFAASPAELQKELLALKGKAR